MIINTIVYTMTFILVIYFIFIIIKINLKKKIKFPPIDAECPNYYIPQNKLGRKVCVARPIYKIYNKNCNMVDTTDMTELEKCNWSRECNVYWEGITNKKINNNKLC